MIFYHIKLRCYVVIELKVVDFEPEFAGKLNFYVSAVDELMKGADDNPTIGLLICKHKDDMTVEWAFKGVDRPLGVAEYENEILKAVEIQEIVYNSPTTCWRIIKCGTLSHKLVEHCLTNSNSKAVQ